MLPTPRGILFSMTACVAAVAFTLLDVPLGAMIGPMLLIALLSHLTGHIESPGPLSHDAAILLIGLALGSQVSSDLFQQLLLWPASLAILVCTITLILWLGGLLNRRILALDPVSAHMAAAPGNLSSALAATEHHGGALSQVAVYQSLRLAFLTLMVPFFFTLPETVKVPLIFTGEDFTIWIGMLSVGWRIGIDTVRQGLGVLLKTIPPALVSTCFALVFALCGAYFAHWSLGFPLIDTILGFMPGAFQVMPVIALETGADGLFVTTHHLVRVLAMGAIIPLTASYWSRT